MLLSALSFFPFHTFSQCIAVFPYTEDFESNNGNWTAMGATSDWAWGAPTKPTISSAGSGTKCWIVGGLTTSFYTSLERSWVQSPCFDFSSLVNPHISFKIYWETEYIYDGGNLQYSIDNGITWINVGRSNDAVDCLNDNWYNSSVNNLTSLAVVKDGWSGTIQPPSGSCNGGSGSGGWLPAQHSMTYLAGESNVIFRFTFGAGSVCNNYDGLAFDDITIEDAPLPITIVNQILPTGCVGPTGKATLVVTGGTPPYNFAWMPAVSISNMATNLSAGNYAVTVTDATGCTKNDAFTIQQSPAVTFSVATTPDTCAAGKGSVNVIVTNGTAPYNYSWNPAVSSSMSAANLTAGNYSVTVTDAEGCTLSSMATIGNINNLKIFLGNDFGICGSSPFTLKAGIYTTYTWQDTSSNATYNGNVAGTYFVTVTDLRGCSASDTLEVFEDCLHDVIVPNSFTPNSDNRNDVFYAYSLRVKSFTMQIYNRLGLVVFETSNINTGWNGNYNGKPLSEGIYVCVIDFSMDGETEMRKLERVLLLR